MRDLINKHLANGLRAFEGARISGQIPVRQEVINELIVDLLRTPPPRDSAGEGADSTAAAKSQPVIPVAQLLPLVKRLELTAEQGKLIVTFDIRVDAP